MQILIIEDNVAIAANLYDYLESCGHSVEFARDGVKGYELASRQSFDAIVLDLGLPRMDGMDICRRLREEVGNDTPILVITARDTLKDKLESFDTGADDYVVKPFELAEVEARLRVLHKRRGSPVVRRILKVGDLVVDPTVVSCVTYGDVTIRLPPKSLRLLEVLMSQPDRVFSRSELEIELWGAKQDTSDRLRYHLHILRKTLARAGGRDPIEGVYGRGYRLAVTR